MERPFDIFEGQGQRWRGLRMLEKGMRGLGWPHRGQEFVESALEGQRRGGLAFGRSGKRWRGRGWPGEV